ncbi:MAG: cytochrome c oxidase subunit 3 [Planctomycetota bacterium]
MEPATAALPTTRKPYTFTPGKLAMWLFLGSDAMGFMGLIGAYMVLRIVSPDWQRPAFDPKLGIPLTAFMTFVLICSSVTMVTALGRIQKDNRRGLLLWLGLTILGGLMFLVLQAYEWTHFIQTKQHLAAEYLEASGQAAPFTNFQSTFFACTGFHGLHVAVGVVYLSCIWVRAWQGAYSASNSSPIELAGLYWHFVDLVWIVLFTIIYLFPDKIAN